MSPAGIPLVLASTSASRQALLRQAGVVFDVVAPLVDEHEIKASMRAAGASVRDVAETLAEAKAVKVSRRLPGVLVLGCDQVLGFGDNQMLDKPQDMAEAASHLRTLSGQTHTLTGAAVMAQDGRAVWRVIDQAHLTMRPISEAFIADYLALEGDVLLSTVGAYRLEARGAQLFSRISGDYFAILGLPLLPVLSYLRDRGLLGA